MKSRWAVNLAHNPVLAALLLVAIFTRALIPAGFMPGPGGLILCHGAMPAPVAVTRAMTHDMSSMDTSGTAMAGTMPHVGHSSHHGGSGEHAGSSLCSFAAAGSSIAGSHDTGLAVSAANEAASPPIPDQPVVRGGTFVSARLPRGPPLPA